jgi:hypothetical protein
MSKQPQQELTEPVTTPKTKHAFLEKKILETLEEFYQFEAYCQRPNLSPEQKKCVVTPEVFDLLSKGDPTLFMDIKGVKVFSSETKDKAEKMLKTDLKTFVI